MKSLVIILLTTALMFWTLPAESACGNPASPGFQEPEQMEEFPEQEPEEMEEMEEAEEEEEEKKEQEGVEQMEEFPEEEEMMEDAPPAKEERMKYYQEKFEETYQNVLFEDVWNAVKQSIKDINCAIIKDSYSQNDEGFYKGVIKSDFCIFAMGDKTLENLEKYSIKVPVIRGGTWHTGRMQYKFIIEENDDGSVYLRLVGEISGFESYVTEQVHFWESNGYLEHMMMKRLRKNLKEEGS